MKMEEYYLPAAEEHLLNLGSLHSTILFTIIIIIIIIFFTEHSICLHIKWYLTSQLSLQKLLIPQPPSLPSLLPFWEYSLTHPLSSAPPLQHPPTPGHQISTGLKVFPPIDVRQGHSLLPMYLEPWIPPCTLVGWWSRGNPEIKEHTSYVLTD